MRHITASRKEIFSWTLFDFANTGFHVIIITLVFPKFFTGVIADGNEAFWGRTISASMLLTALIGPLLGSIADASHRKKIFLGFFTLSCVVATSLLYFTGEGTLWLAVLLVIVANLGFEGGTIFYDAFLPDIASEKNYSKVSGYGFAMGYLGSFIILITVLPLLAGDPVPEGNIKLTFLIAAGFFAIFSLPLFFVVKERQRPREIEGNPLIVGYKRLRETFTHLRRYDAVKRFLIAFFVYNDSILTVILFAGIFASQTLNLSTTELIYFFMIVQGSALLGSLFFGAISNSIGARQSIIITLVIWIGVVTAAYFITTATAFFILGAAAGIALGSSQSSSRTLMALLTPEEKRTEFFGFYDGFFGKASAVIGPLVFGEVSRWLGQRPAMLVIGGMFVVGILLVLRVPDARYETGNMNYETE
jgi:UMF1 family MFS transporter